MRRVGIFLLAVIALVAMTGPVSAQPKVTITGFVDNISTWQNNISLVDLNYARKGDPEWYARTRVRPDITAEVGTTKFVLGLEIDSTWGQTGATDGGGGGAGPQRFGTTSGFDINTDMAGVIEVKWAYTEFNVPLIPVPSRMRLGAQAFETQYKLAALANGDFAGVHMTNQWAPMIKSSLTYAQIEESSTGPRDTFIRGDDFAFIASVEITPFKGLDIRPIFSYANFVGVTSGSSRQARGGLGTGAGVYQTCPGTAGPGTGACPAAGASSSAVEDRFTVGVDARWRFGPFSLDPTVFYQFGEREQTGAASFTSSPGTLNSLRRDAWFVDIRGGWQAGPLLLELAGVYTTGNKAEQRIDLGRNRLQYYEPINTDTSYYAGWANLQALGIDYFSAGRESGGALFTGVGIGYDKYGLIRVGARGSYALTPAFTLNTAAVASWTAEDVDTRGTIAAGNATGITPRCAIAAVDAGTCTDSGTASFLGTEINLGFQWRFAPNVAFDLVGAYLFAGNALSAHLVTNTATGVASNARNPQDVQSVAMRVRYSF